MNINRHNYESFFLLYADNELTAAERKAVEEFVQQNPDLERELALLQQLVFRPEDEVVFAGKKDLMRSEHPATGIHTGNYESFFLLYADNELTTGERKNVEAFLDLHPRYKGELELLCTVRMSPDTSIVYAGKEDLYRREKERVVVFAWWRLAAAAILLLLLGLWWINRPATSIPIARNNDKSHPVHEKAPQQSPAPVTAQTITVNPAAPAPAINTGNKKNSRKQQDNNNPILVKTTRNRKAQPVMPENNNLPPLHKMTDDNQQLAVTTPENDHLPQRSGPLPERPHHIIAVNTVKTPGRENLINRLTNINSGNEDNSVAQLTSYDNNDQIDVLNTSVNKTTLRGFLRKASRIIAKKTSTDDNSDDDQKHILIGSFAIAVK